MRHTATAAPLWSPAEFEAIYDCHSSTAYGLAVRMLGRTQEAEDVVQEAFLDLWRSTGYRPERGPLRPFLLRIVRNRAIDRLRRDRRVPAPVGAPDEAFEQADGRPTPDAQVAQLDEGRLVRSALASLPREQSDVLELAYFAGLSHSGISRHLGVPLGTIKGRMRLGLEKLRAELAHGALARPERPRTDDAVQSAA